MLAVHSLNFPTIIRLAHHQLPEEPVWEATVRVVRKNLGELLTDELFNVEPVPLHTWQELEQAMAQYVKKNRSYIHAHIPPLQRSLAPIIPANNNTTNHLKDYITAKANLHSRLQLFQAANTNDEAAHRADLEQIFAPLTFFDYVALNLDGFLSFSETERDHVIDTIGKCLIQFHDKFTNMILTLHKRTKYKEKSSMAVKEIATQTFHLVKDRQTEFISSMVRIARIVAVLQNVYQQAIGVTLPAKQKFHIREQQLNQLVKTVMEKHTDQELLTIMNTPHHPEHTHLVAPLVLYLMWVHRALLKMQPQTTLVQKNKEKAA